MVILRRFTVAEFYRMAQVGILRANERLELIEGQIIIERSPSNPHAACVDRLNELLIYRSGENAIVRVQSHIRLSKTSAPRPDITLLKYRADFYAGSTPRPADVLLLIEVSDSTLNYDRGTKARLYAHYGIAEYWVVNVSGQQVEVFMQPSSGGYKNVRTFERGEIIAALIEGLSVGVDEVLG